MIYQRLLMIVRFCKTQMTHNSFTAVHSTLPHLITQAQKTRTRAKTNTNGLMLNSIKTQCLFIGTRALTKHIPENTTIMFNNSSITPSKYVKNLGIYMDCNLSFDTHIHEIHKKVMGTLLFINRMKKNLKKVREQWW